MAASSPSGNNTKQVSGATFMFAFDVGAWDNSLGLSVPGNSAQPGSPHYADLAPYWGEGKHFPLLFSRAEVEKHLESKLVLEPLREYTTAADAGAIAAFEPVQPELFRAGGAQPNAWADFDNDGRFDLYVANYGPNALYHNEGGGRFRDVAPEMGVAGDYHGVTAAWGDYDNDGRLDLYVTAALANVTNYRDYLYRNEGDHFTDVTPGIVLKHDATQGVQWADFDGDGALDLAMANNEPYGTHSLLRNLLAPERARRSFRVLVLDERGRYTRAGSEIRVYAAGTRNLLATRLVDTISGYCSQNVLPVHVAVAQSGPVDVEVTSFTKAGRQVTRVANVNPGVLAGKPLVVRTSRPAATTSTR
jgi:hypothetical protein